MKHFSELTPSAERVLDAAQSLLQQRGYSGFSIDDVAKDVGIRKPSVHHHFATKAELVATIVQRYAHRFEAELARIEAEQPAAPDRLAAYAGLFARTFADERRLCVCGMLGAEADALPAEVVLGVERFFAANVDWLARVIAHGQRNGLVRRKPAAGELAATYFGALEGAMVLGRGMQTAAGPKEVGRTLLSLVLA